MKLRNRTKSFRVLWALLFILLFSACGLLGPPDPEYRGTVLVEPIPKSEFRLSDAEGRQVSLDDYEGKIILLYFGYTFCPDICPTTLADLAQVQRELDDAAEEIQVLMVTVDPERDTPQVLSEYVGHFHDTFVGLSGPVAEIEAAAAPYDVFVQTGEGSAASGYLVDHTSRVFVIDPAGDYYLSFGFGTLAEDMIADLRTMLKQF